MGLNLRLPFMKSKSRGDGIHVISRTDGGTTLELRNGSRVELLQVPATVPLLVERYLDGTRSRLSLQARGASNESSRSWEFDTGSEAACSAQYDELVRGLRMRRNAWKSPWTVAAVLLAIVIIATPTPTPSSAETSQVVGSASSLPVPPVQPVDMPGPRLSASELTEVTLAKGIALRKEGTAFYVFSDPNCPFCKELEVNLTNIESGLNPTIVPVGFKPGSREKSAMALCSPDPAKVWHEMLVDVAPATAVIAPPCEKGLQQVDANNALFERLQFTSTPTMVSPKGHIVVGSGTTAQIHGAMAQ